MKLQIWATMSDGLEAEDYLPTDFAIGDAITVYESSGGDDSWIQLTYDTLRLPSGYMGARWRCDTGRWELQEILGPDFAGRTVSDLVIAVQP